MSDEPASFRESWTKSRMIVERSFQATRRLTHFVELGGMGVFVVPFLSLGSLSPALFSLGIADLFPRLALDYRYLMINRPDFADIYAGGIFAQICIIAVFLVLHLIILIAMRNDIILFTDKLSKYFTIYLTAIIICGVGVYLFFNMSDYDFSGLHSWFYDDPSSTSRRLPIPASRVALIMTGFGASIMYLFGACLIQVFVLLLLAKRKKWPGEEGQPNG